MGNKVALTKENMNQRRQLNLHSAQEVMRSKISFTQTFDRILSIELDLLAMCRPQLVFDQVGNMTAVAASPDTGAVAALKTVLDSCYKRLNKVLPDLKSIDVVAALEQDEDVTSRLLDPIEMRKRVLHAMLAKAEEDTPSFLK